MADVYSDVSKVDCKDMGERLFCKLYSGHPSTSGSFVDERDVDYVEAEEVEDLHGIPSSSREDLRYPSENGNIFFEVPADHGCSFAEGRLTCGSWLG